MTFAYTFTSTHQDLIDSYEAYRAARTRIRGWFRATLIAFAFLWLLGAVMALAAGSDVEAWWEPVVWLGIPLGILYYFLVKPRVAKRHILRSNPPVQEVGLTFTDSGLDVLVAGVLRYQRSWSEFAQVIDAAKGIVMIFTDGSAHWVPNRIFKDSQERVALAEYVMARIPGADDRAA